MLLVLRAMVGKVVGIHLPIVTGLAGEEEIWAERVGDGMEAMDQLAVVGKHRSAIAMPVVEVKA